MFAYYFGLALRSLRRNVVLTALMIAAIGVGIGASMTVLTIYRVMAQDPIPEKSAQLFTVQIDNWGPQKNFPRSSDAEGSSGDENLPNQISYTDAMGLMNAHAARRQAAMYYTGLALTPANPQLQPFEVDARATYADFFPMFAVPFLYGGPWGAAEDALHADVIVITRDLNVKLFAGANSVGKSVNLDDHEYRVVGVLGKWAPIPQFFDLNGGKYLDGTGVYLPFTRAIDRHMGTWGNTNCRGDIGEGWEGMVHSECVWIQFWSQLPTAAAVAGYRAFLKTYAAEQQRTGRFHWPAYTKLRDVREWLDYQHAVSDEVRILVLVSFSFLFVCLLNAMGLMLAKIMGRIADISVRRALGANRGAIFSQCLIEAAVIGLAGGALGLALTALGLLGLRSLLSEEIEQLAHLDGSDIGIAVLLAVIATMLAGLYPTWRASRVQPAWQLKAQ